MRIALRAATGYMTAEEGGEPQPKRGLVTANRSQIGAWEIWTVEPHDGGIALKSCNGLYLCAEFGGGGLVAANRPVAGGWEHFSPEPAMFGDRQVIRLGAEDGVSYLSIAPTGDHVVAADGKLGEKFTVEVVEADAEQPEQPPPPSDAPGYWFAQGFLTTHGMDFYAGETPWPFAGIATHLLFNELVAGRDIVPLLRAWKACGANTTITIGVHASPFKNANGYRLVPTEVPDYYEKLGRFFDIHAAEGMRAMFRIWGDKQYTNFNQNDHFYNCCRVMDGRWNVFATKGNESQENGWREDDYSFPDLHGVLKSQGSQGGEVNPHVPYLDFCEFETTRGRKRLYDCGAGMRQLFDGDFQGPATQRPTLDIEPTAFNDVNPDHVGDTRETDWHVALAMALNIFANCAGGGLTMSKPMEAKSMTAADENIARQWFRGARAGFCR